MVSGKETVQFRQHSFPLSFHSQSVSELNYEMNTKHLYDLDLSMLL